jgi:thioredoxin-related protein
MKPKLILTLWMALILAATGCNRGDSSQTQSHAAPTGPIDFEAEVSRAKAENKLLFLDFTGSDWCPPCMMLEKEVFSQPEFKRYAQDHLVFVVVDFPRRTRLPVAIQEANNRLAEKFNVEAFPTLVVVDASGNEVWRQVGFPEDGMRGLIGALDKLKPRT